MKKPMYELEALKSQKEKLKNAIKSYEEAIQKSKGEIEDLTELIEKHHDYNAYLAKQK